MGKGITLTREGLRKALQEMGFTYRESRKLVKTILNTLATNLKTNGTIELPFGILSIEQTPKPMRRYRFGKIVTVFKRRKRVRYKHKKDQHG